MEQIKKTTSLALIINLILMLVFFVFEPAASLGASDSITVTQSVTSEISISAPDDVSMSPAIPGMTGGTATGSATWNIKTNDTSGFNMALKASTNPALKAGSYTFDDYTEGTPDTPDYNWSIAAGVSEFGYSVEPATLADTVAAFKDNGSDTCGGAGASQTADKCWLGLTTSDFEVIDRSTQTSAAGEDEVVKFTAQVGSSSFQEEGSYTATVTATAVTN